MKIFSILMIMSMFVVGVPLESSMGNSDRADIFEVSFQTTKDAVYQKEKQERKNKQKEPANKDNEKSLKYDFAICAIFQDDAPFLHEWIEFHKIQGTQHFFLYNNCSEDNYLEVLAPYIEANEVTLVDWPYLHDNADRFRWNSIQCGAYIHCLQNYGTNSTWIAFIDTDEFLFCPSGKTLANFLKLFKNYGGVAANWNMFGTSNIYDIPTNGLMIEFLTRSAGNDYGANLHIKSIVQPKYTVICENPHYFQYIPGKYAVETDYTPVNGAFSSTIKLDKLCINHYWTRTERYLLENKIPRRNHMYGEDKSGILKMVEELNSEENKAILQFVPKLRKNMGF